LNIHKRTVRSLVLAAVLAASLSGPAVALTLTTTGSVADQIMLEKGPPGGPYAKFDPCTAKVFIGEEIFLSVTLMNNSGLQDYLAVGGTGVAPGIGDPGMGCIPPSVTGCLRNTGTKCLAHQVTDINGYYFVYPDIPQQKKFNINEPLSPLNLLAAEDAPFTRTLNEKVPVRWKYEAMKVYCVNMNIAARTNYDPDCLAGQCLFFPAAAQEGSTPLVSICINPQPSNTNLTDILPCPICIISPLDASAASYVPASVGVRPPGRAFIGDWVRLDITVTNSGVTDISLTPDKVCVVMTPPQAPSGGSQLCASGWDDPAACPSGISPYEASWPVLVTKSGGAHTFSWTFSATGGNYCVKCSAGTGSLFFDADIKGTPAESATLVVGPAPITISVSMWVDPDAGGALVPVPLGTVLGDPTTAANLYYMSPERAQARITIRNTSPYPMDLHPESYVQDQYGVPRYLITSGPSGVVNLPGFGTRTFTWEFAPDPAYLGDCQADSYALTFSFYERGVQTDQLVALYRHPFSPASRCPINTGYSAKPITFLVPDNALFGIPLPVVLNMRNNDNRVVRMAPPAMATVFIVSDTLWSFGALTVTLLSGPVPASDLPLNWNVGETKSFTWTYSTTAEAVWTYTSTGVPANACWEAGLQWPSGASCVAAGSEQYPRCEDPAMPPRTEWRGCLNAIPEPQVYIEHFWHTAPGTVAATDQDIPVEMCLVNKSYTQTVTINSFCGGSIEGTPPGILAGPFNTIEPLPHVILPSTPAVSSSAYFHWNVRAGDCGSGALLGCFWQGGPGLHMVRGNPSVDLPGMTSNTFNSTIPINFYLPGGDDVRVFTDKSEYSGGQTITVTLTVTNQGQNDAINFSRTLTAIFNPPGSGVFISQTPVTALGTLAGTGICQVAPPYAGQTEMVVYTFSATGEGTFCFQGAVFGTDNISLITKTRTGNQVCGRIAKPSILVITAAATPLVTMTRTCPGCAPFSDCPTKGQNCITVTMTAHNKGQITLIDALPVHDVDVVSCAGVTCPGTRTYTGSADQGGASPNVDIPGTLGEGDTATYTWTFTPTGLGCVRFFVQMYGKDGATGVEWREQKYTNCVDIIDRRPVELKLVSLPPSAMLGQEFEVSIEIYNPGSTAVTLRGGEPALIFISPDTGAAITDRFEVRLETPVSVKVGERKTVKAKVRVLPGAPLGAVEVRVPQSTMYATFDSQTGFPVSIVNTGGTLVFQVIPPKSGVISVVPNPFYPLKYSTMTVTYGLGKSARMKVKLYTITGELVKTLVDGDVPLGLWTVQWDGRNSDNRVCASGIYILRYEVPDHSEVKKLAVLK